VHEKKALTLYFSLCGNLVLLWAQTEPKKSSLIPISFRNFFMNPYSKKENYDKAIVASGQNQQIKPMMQPFIMNWKELFSNVI
jgi:hypothetical protein